MKTIREIIDGSYKEGFTMHYELTPHPKFKNKILLSIYGVPSYCVDGVDAYISRELDRYWPEIFVEYSEV